MTTNINEADKQLILLALAELSKTRPGWNYALSKIAEKLQGLTMYKEFQTIEERFKIKQVVRKLDGIL